MAGYPREASLFLEALASRINATPVIPPSPGATSILEFAKLMNPYFETPRHIQEIAKYLEAAERGDIKRLMIMTSPQHGKSLMVSQMFPSWAMGRNPRRKFILASYGVERAVPNSRKARDNIVHPLFPFPDCKLSMKSQAVDQWETEAGGSCLAAGVGGRITGFGADFLLIDDPVKGQDEADSPLMRDKTWEWYTRDARSRLAPNAAIIVIMTRWNEDDLAGRLIAQGGWTVLNMPAMAEENDVLGRKPGEYLWTDHYSIQDYVDTEREVGPKAWDSLYQQRPSTAGGGIFQNGWWREYSIAKLADMGLRPALITVDSAFKDGVQNDYSVAAVWGHMNGAAYLIDIWRDRATFPVLVEKMRSLYKRYRAPIVIEDAASGQSLVQVLSQPLPDQPAIPVVAYKLRKGTSKISRAESVTRYIEQGLVYLPDHAIWKDEFVREHSQFPHSKYDDQVDTTSIALARIFNTAERRDPTDYYYNKPHEARGNRIITKFRDARRAAQAAKLEKILV